MCLKIWCEECEGTCDYSEWDACDISDDGRDCPTCNGKGYIEREIKAEDLSVEEQKRIIKKFLRNFYEENRSKTMIIDHLHADGWEGLKEL